MANSIRIVLADDHPLFAEGIALLLNSIEGLEVVGIANTGKEVIQILKEKACNLALLDVHMPVMDGIEASRQIKSLYPHIQIIALTMEDELSVIEKMKQAGATGYVLKTADKPTLHQAILSAMQQAKVNNTEPAPANKHNSKQESGRQAEMPLHNLTDREIEILHLIAQGYSTSQMAGKLSISPKTVETHRKNMLKKVKVKNIMGLINYGIQHGIIRIKP